MKRQQNETSPMYSLTNADQVLANKILAHCSMMAKHDRAYAVFAWKQYCEALPWLGLEKIKKGEA